MHINIKPLNTNTMKQLVTLLVLVFLISCQSKKESEKIFEDYNQGLKAMHNVDSVGRIDYANAIGYFEKSVYENPTHIESRLWKMQCEINLGKFDNALETSAYVINDKEMANHVLIPIFYFTAGLVEKIKGDTIKSYKFLNSAIEIYNSRIRKDKNDTEAIMNKASVLCYMDKKDEAIKFLDSITINEENKTNLEQIKSAILGFDAEEIISDLMANR